MGKKWICTVLAAGLMISALVGCGNKASGEKQEGTSQTAAGEKVFVFGDTTFNAENGEPDINPHNDNSGWACIRYGVGETLFRFSDTMGILPADAIWTGKR